MSEKITDAMLGAMLDAAGDELEAEARRERVRKSEETEAKVEQVVQEAIDRGERAATDRLGVGPLTPIERYAVESLTDYAVDPFRGRDADPEAQVKVAAMMAEELAADPLLRKLLAAWALEYTVTDDGLPDGIVGQAADKAIEAVTPYAKRQRLWWSKVMET